jgi:glutamyl-tRNA synthetase
LAWAKNYDLALAKVLEDNKDYTLAVLGIERGVVGGRKDIAKWADVRKEIGYFFDDIFVLSESEAREWLDGIKWEDVKTAVEKMLATYNPEDDKDAWFGKIKEIAVILGYAENGKAFKLEPEKYKGQVGDIAKIFRVLLTGRAISPDLHQVMRVLGQDRIKTRLEKFIK